MRLPEPNQALSDDEHPLIVRRIFLLAAIGSVAMAVLAWVMVKPGYEEVMGLKQDPWGDRDRGVACVAGFTTAVAGMLAAWQGWSGRPAMVARVFAIVGFILNFAVLTVGGYPFLTDWLKRVAG